MLAAVIKGPTLDAALDQMEKAGPVADLFEIRLDGFLEEAGPFLPRLVSASKRPLLFTFRKEAQGGMRQIEERDRLKAIEESLSHHPAFLDLEADTERGFLERMAKKFPQTKFIGSYHHFESTPEDLEELLQSMRNPHFYAYKIACMAQSTLDLLRLMAFAQKHADKTPISCIAMGELGQPSRVIGPIVGNFIDYASLGESPANLHQIDLGMLATRYRYKSLNRQTEIFALLGNPVAHSPGDQFHNDVFKKEGKNAVYVKLRLDPDELPAFHKLFRRLPFRGFSVTIPLKEEIIPFLDRIDPIAVAIGAVNTITVSNQLAIGTNTDSPGALNAIEKHMKVKNKRVAILGAGGTARAIGYGAKLRGAHVKVYSRTYKRAKELASDLGIEGHPLEDIGGHAYDLLINTIPPSADGAPPFDFELILPSAYVMDVVYRPKETPILQAAKAKGCHCIYGEEFFVEQARLQQSDWTKKYRTVEL